MDIMEGVLLTEEVCGCDGSLCSQYNLDVVAKRNIEKKKKKECVSCTKGNLDIILGIQLFPCHCSKNTPIHFHNCPIFICSVKCERIFKKTIDCDVISSKPFDGKIKHESYSPFGINCDLCGKNEKGVRFKHCAACKNIVYCSKECQKNDWSRHKKMCKLE